MELENIGKRTRTADKRNTKRIQETEDRISTVEDGVEVINTAVRENVKTKKFLT